MAISLNLPKEDVTGSALSGMKAKIVVFGVGGAGTNAVNNMISANVEGVDFVVANTDAQALLNSKSPNRLQLGAKLTKGLGAGAHPERGRDAAEESMEAIARYMEDANMVFITAGMGGGTGTGAAPIIAKMAHERGILTVAVVTKPFDFEGKYRMTMAEAGIAELKKHIDTQIIIPNQNLFRVSNAATTFESAFKMADDVLHSGVRGITDLITMPGLINLDFADVETVMTKMGKAMMGTGEAQGENRALAAAEAAISNPLLDNISIKGAKGVLINITGNTDMTLFEADIAVKRIIEEVDPNANIIFGSAFNPDLKDRMRVSVVATGIDADDEDYAQMDYRDDNAIVIDSIVDEQNSVAGQEEEYEEESPADFFNPGVPVEPNSAENQTNDYESKSSMMNNDALFGGVRAGYSEAENGEYEAFGSATVTSKSYYGDDKIDTGKQTITETTPILDKKKGLFGRMFSSSDGLKKKAESLQTNSSRSLKQQSKTNHGVKVIGLGSDDDIVISDEVFKIPALLRNQNNQ